VCAPLGCVPIQSSAYGMPAVRSSSSIPSEASTPTSEASPSLPHAYVLTCALSGKMRSIITLAIGEAAGTSDFGMICADGGGLAIDCGANVTVFSGLGRVSGAAGGSGLATGATGSVHDLDERKTTVHVVLPSSSIAVLTETSFADPSDGMSREAR
jgi:hypothetical protein